MLRYLTAGESHGQGLVVVVEGLPAGLPITVEEIQGELARRRLGYGRGPRMRFEQDELTLIGGRPPRPDPGLAGRDRDRQQRVEAHRQVARRDVARTGPDRATPRPSPGPATPISPACRSTASPTPATCSSGPRPAETAARVAAGTVAKALLAHLGVEIVSHVIQIGAARTDLDGPARARPISRRSTTTRCGASIRRPPTR